MITGATFYIDGVYYRVAQSKSTGEWALVESSNGVYKGKRFASQNDAYAFGKNEEIASDMKKRKTRPSPTQTRASKIGLRLVKS